MSIEVAFWLGKCKEQVGFKMPAIAHCWIVVFLCLFLGLLLAGCGTSVAGLLEEDSRLLWQADEVIEAAEGLDLGLENSVYDAEAAKREACESLIDAARERMYATDRSFAEEFRSDIGQLYVRVVPVESVEKCAEAQKRYKEEIATLCRDLGNSGIQLRCSD